MVSNCICDPPVAQPNIVALNIRALCIRQLVGPINRVQYDYILGVRFPFHFPFRFPIEIRAEWNLKIDKWQWRRKLLLHGG